ncbi:uncharacterized protein [Argopecten irradians]|uniref:uncharacterized protein n=1 Tax=Argopecten irradians TaxID=31199 RepID=UPI003711315C
MEAGMSVLLFLCVLVSLHAVDAKPKLRCVFPSQWQSDLFFDFDMRLMGRNQIDGSGMFYFDYPNQQMRFDFTGVERVDNSSVDFTLIWKFNEPAFYTIDNSDHTCERQAGVSSFWKQWKGVPGDAWPHYYGGIGGFKEILGQYEWTRMNGGPLGKIAVTMDARVGDFCAPVRLLIRDQSQSSYGTFSVYYEFLDNIGLKSPNVFIPPRHCQNSTTLVTGNRWTALSRDIFI